MERSRIRTLLGLGLLLVGTCLLVRALAVPVVHGVFWADRNSVVVEAPAMPEMPAMPAMPEMPEMPAMPSPPHAHSFWVWGMWFSPATILLALLVLLLLRRSRTVRETPLA